MDIAATAQHVRIMLLKRCRNTVHAKVASKPFGVFYDAILGAAVGMIHRKRITYDQ